MTKIQIAINGAAGRMGRRLIALASQDPSLELVAALEHSDCAEIGRDAGEVAAVGSLNVAVTSSLDCDPNVVIDFSVPASAQAITQICLERHLPLVMATTGLDEAQKSAIAAAAEQIPVVWAPNMSLAVNLTMRLAMLAGEKLAAAAGGADVEIIERHHHFKEDAPSGTALRFGELIAQVMGQTEHLHGRHGLIGPRPQNEIGYHALRVGDNPGEHTIVFGLMGETIELTVRATNRDCYAVGALAAAKFLATRPPGLYSMFDVLGW